MKIKTEMLSFEIGDPTGNLLFIVEDDMINIYHAPKSEFIEFKRVLTFKELVKAMWAGKHYEDKVKV